MKKIVLLLTLLMLILPLQARAFDLQKIIASGTSKTLGVTVNDKALRVFYEKRKFAPAWDLQETNAPEVIKEFTNFVRETLTEHGLSENNYPFAALDKAVADKKLHETDLIASAIVLRLATSLGGQDPVPQSDMHTWPLRHEKIDIPATLNDAINNHHVPGYLNNLTPQTPAYKKLKDTLAQYREIAAKGGWIRVRPGLILTPQDDDPRVTQIYQRLAQEGYIAFEAKHFQNTVYDDALVEAMRAFQETHGLYPDGHIGPETMRAMNVPINERIDQIRVNMARLRASPHNVAQGIIINIPSARLSYYKDGQLAYEAPVVVGRVDRPTPLVISVVNEIIVNPTWYVPSSIAEKDLFPKAEEDSDFLQKQGIKKHVSADGKSVMLRQDPGPLNSLGRIKFNFPNRHAVYLHGTPHVELFGRDDRTRSSGCIRLKEPIELTEILMQNPADWNAGTIQKKIDSLKTQRVNPPGKTPIKLLYWTTQIDAKDRVSFYLDVYGLDAEWLKLL